MSSLGNKQIMADNLIYYMNLKGISRKDLCNDLGFKYTTVTGWITAEKYPRIDKIEIMANYFGISKSDLVEKQDSPGRPNSEHAQMTNWINNSMGATKKDAPESAIDLSEIEFALMGEVRELDDEDIAELIRDAQRFRELKELRKRQQSEGK